MPFQVARVRDHQEHEQVRTLFSSCACMWYSFTSLTSRGVIRCAVALSVASSQRSASTSSCNRSFVISARAALP